MGGQPKGKESRYPYYRWWVQGPYSSIRRPESRYTNNRPLSAVFAWVLVLMTFVSQWFEAGNYHYVPQRENTSGE